MSRDDVSRLDVLTYCTVSAGLLLSAGLASYLPARRASGMDPVIALRAE
jgi:ABC-type lipoprotein release transport system permease subunit